MPPRVYVIVNPAAGRGRAVRAWQKVAPALRDAGLVCDEVLEDRPQLAIPLAETAAARGYDIVVAAGGDGTVHEVVNGLMRADETARPALAIIPGGTGNDFARAVGVSQDPLAAGRLLLAAVRRRVDIGQVNERYFASISGVGFDAEVAHEVNTWPKWIGGTTVYMAAILRMLVTFSPVQATVTLDGQTREVPMFLLAAANSPWYAGGMYMAPPARLDDGTLEVILAGDLTKLETLRVLPKVFSGEHLKHPKVFHASAREIRVESTTPLWIHADGETVGRAPAVFRVIPRALDVIVPDAGREAAGARSPG